MQLILTTLAGLVTAEVGLAKSSVVVYWGQNSYGASHPNTPQDWEKDLGHLCQDASVDVVAISFLHNLNGASGQPPEINLSKHCWDTFPGTAVLNCPAIADDIKQCQSNGKTVLLSLGGANANTAFYSDETAIKAALNVWDMFLGGTHPLRPFGTAILDGIDLDIEGGSQAHYDKFLETLRTLFASSKKTYLVTAAPQCVYPDQNLQTILDSHPIDALFVQFYNNRCGVHNPQGFNWHQWEAWANTIALNKNVSLFLGIPASQSAASFGYVPPAEVAMILDRVVLSPRFGGVMLWDASQNQNNLIQGSSFSQHAKQAMARASGSLQARSTTEPILLAQEDSSPTPTRSMCLVLGLIWLITLK